MLFIPHYTEGWIVCILPYKEGSIVCSIAGGQPTQER